MRIRAPFKEKFDKWSVEGGSYENQLLYCICFRVMNYVQFGLRQKFVEMSKMDMRRYNLARRLAGKKASCVYFLSYTC